MTADLSIAATLPVFHYVPPTPRTKPRMAYSFKKCAGPDRPGQAFWIIDGEDYDRTGLDV